MTSEERRAARRARREMRREAKLSKKTVAWKASVQRYMNNLLRNTWDLQRKLSSGVDITMGFICFTLNERGKTRHIRSVHFKERVVQRCVCDYALVPMLSRTLVYENGASLAGKGIHFHIFLCSRQLHRYYRENGFSNKGWILQIDFKSYFDNIEHAPLKEIIMRAFHDRHMRWLIWRFVKAFGDKSLGIGSQVSQILAVTYPNRIDHYAWEVLGLHLSARYADDSYYMHPDKAYLEWCLEQLKAKFADAHIILNSAKTQIIPIRRFTFLKVRFYLTKTGKVVLKPCRDSITRNRRKLKSIRRMVDEGTMTPERAVSSYFSWYGYQNHLDAHDTLRDADKLFYRLFHIWPKHRKKKKRKVFYR